MTKTTEGKFCDHCLHPPTTHTERGCSHDGCYCAPPATERAEAKVCPHAGTLGFDDCVHCAPSPALPERPRMTEACPVCGPNFIGRCPHIEPAPLARDQVDAAKARVFLPTLFDMAEEAQNAACVMAFFCGLYIEDENEWTNRQEAANALKKERQTFRLEEAAKMDEAYRGVVEGLKQRAESAERDAAELRGIIKEAEAFLMFAFSWVNFDGPNGSNLCICTDAEGFCFDVEPQNHEEQCKRFRSMSAKFCAALAPSGTGEKA